MEKQRNIIFGIDLGTTHSCIAYVDEHGKAVIIPNKEHHLTTPSVVLFEGDLRIVGEEAKQSALLHPDAVVEMVKRHMGEANWRMLYDEREYTAEEISSYILRKMVNDAQEALGIAVKDVVITCPAYFGIPHREATMRAGEIAGLRVHEIINEPTAAAITYGIGHEEEEVVLVYDLGGGTFDVTIITIKAGAITVIATGGDHHLGGRNWDEALVVYLAGQWQSETGSLEDPLESAETLQDLWLKAERAKKTLSARKSTRVVVTHGGLTAKVVVTREKFDELTAGLLDRTVLFTRMTMEEAKKRGCNRIDQVLLVGGSSRMLQVSERLEHELHLPLRIFEPEEAVAKGAAIYGQKLLLDQHVQQSVSRINEKAPTPKKSSAKTAPTVQQQAQTEVASSLGIKEQTVERLIHTSITNVTSHSFGIIVTLDHQTKRSREVVQNLVMVNDPLPTMRVHLFGTLEADQETVELRVVETGETAQFVEPDRFSEEAEIGKVTLPLPPGLPARSPIEVVFELDRQGLLHVIGREPQSGTTVDASFQTKGGISEGEIRTARKRVSKLTIL